MASVGDISVSIGLDISELQRNLQRVETELGSLRNSFSETSRSTEQATGRMGKALGGLASSFAGTQLLSGLGGAVGDILKSTADLQSLDSQYTQVLGKMKGQSDTYLNDMAKKWNKHPNELKSSFMQYDALLKSKGVSESDAYKLSQDYLQRTVDASAFANEDMATTTSRFMGGIKGEYDSLDTAMVNLSATMLDQKATEQYGKKFDKLTVTQQETLKVQEALRQHTSAGVFGQGGREADSYQNNIDMLKSTFEELKASIGSPILATAGTVLKDIGGVLKSVADWFSKLPKPAQEFTVVVTIMTIAMIGLALAVGGVVIGLGLMATELGIGIGMLAGIIAGVVVAVAVLVAVVYLVIKYWDEIKAFTIAVWTATIAWLKSAWETISAKATEVWQKVSTAISTAISGIVAWLKSAWESISSKTTEAWNAISTAISTAISGVVAWLSSTWNTIVSATVSAFNSIVAFLVNWGMI
jgi:phage-related minor tail protein